MCIFCQIAEKKSPADIVFEDDKIIAFKDINPSANIHILIIPKKHISSLNDIKREETELLGELLFRAKEIAKEKDIASQGYKVVINTGEDGGQIIDHLHVHLLGGERITKLV